MLRAASIGVFITDPCERARPLATVVYWQVRNSVNNTSKVILASGSPRRRELLAKAGIRFEVVASGIPEERAPDETARDYALRMAREKSQTVSSQFPEAVVLGADTIVVCDDQILEKPRSSDDARRMLTMLSGRVHTVITAFSICRGGTLLEGEPVESRVTFRGLSAQEIDDYIATGEPFDKAGGYGIQNVNGNFIAQVEGSRDNVMGLPTDRVIAALERNGVKST
jgi:septum formation protein